MLRVQVFTDEGEYIGYGFLDGCSIIKGEFGYFTTFDVITDSGIRGNTSVFCIKPIFLQIEYKTGGKCE